MPTPIDLHLVTWNRPAMTRLVIKAIHRNTKPGTFRLHVFDNGSSKAFQNELREMDYQGAINDLTLFRGNQGLEAAREQLRLYNVWGDYFVCIDNDCLPPPILDGVDWLQRQLSLIESYPEFGAISQRTQVMIGTGNIFEEADAVGDDIVEFPWPGGSYRIMRTKAANQVGGWSEPHAGRGHEERFIGAALKEAGWRTAFATKIQCLHLFGLRDAKNATDRWGYDKHLEPADTGHSDIDHPALRNGDDLEEVARYVGEELANDYRDN